jgi:hypothetical protein
MDWGDLLPVSARLRLPVGCARWRSPVGTRIHELWDLQVRGCVPATLPRRLHAVFFLRRMPQAVRLQVHASASTLWLTGRRILEVAPYRYNL